MQIEKEHKRSILINRKKGDLVDYIMCLEHNNNVLHDTIDQQVINFKKIQHDTFDELKNKSFKVDTGQSETDAVKLAEIENALLN